MNTRLMFRVKNKKVVLRLHASYDISNSKSIGMWSGTLEVGDVVYDVDRGGMYDIFALFDNKTIGWLVPAGCVTSHEERYTHGLVPAWHPYPQTQRVLQLLNEPVKDLDVILKDPHPGVDLDPLFKESLAKAKEQLKQVQEELKRVMEYAHPRRLWGEAKVKADKEAEEAKQRAEEREQQRKRSEPLAVVYYSPREPVSTPTPKPKSVSLAQLGESSNPEAASSIL